MRTSAPATSFSKKDRSSRATPKAGHFCCAPALRLRPSIQRRRRCARTSEKPASPNAQSPHCFGRDLATQRGFPAPGSVFGLQPTLLLFMIFFIKRIEKVENIRDTLRQEYRTERRSGAKVAL